MVNQHFKLQATASKSQPTTNVWESLGMDQWLRPQVVKKRKGVEEVMEGARKELLDYVDRCEMPMFLIPKLRELEIDGGVIDVKYGGPQFSNLEFGALCFEIAKVDPSVSTFVAVHNSIGMNVVHTLGDEE